DVPDTGGDLARRTSLAAGTTPPHRTAGVGCGDRPHLHARHPAARPALPATLPAARLARRLGLARGLADDTALGPGRDRGRRRGRGADWGCTLGVNEDARFATARLDSRTRNRSTGGDAGGPSRRTADVGAQPPRTHRPSRAPLLRRDPDLLPRH